MSWVFRGFDAVGDKGWVYGDLAHTKRVLLTEPYLSDRVEVGHYEVHPDSVGLCTGVKDDNGTVLYEGDICRVTAYGRQFNMQVLYHNGGFMYGNGGTAFAMNMAIISVKIGTVFENRRLLDEKD